MGMESRNPYMLQKTPNPATPQQIEAGSPESSVQSRTVEELSLSLEAVIQKVTLIEGRMSVLETSFETLLQKTTELTEELRLAREQLGIRNRLLLGNSIEADESVEETERLRTIDTSSR